jgi:hypothetical protein
MAEVSVLLSAALRSLYARRRRETGYRSKDAVEGLEALRRVLTSPPSEDFDHLCDLRRPDLTVEAFVLSLENKEELFSSEELAVAAARVTSGEALVRSRRIVER